MNHGSSCSHQRMGDGSRWRLESRRAPRDVSGSCSARFGESGQLNLYQAALVSSCDEVDVRSIATKSSTSCMERSPGLAARLGGAHGACAPGARAQRARPGAQASTGAACSVSLASRSWRSNKF